MIRTIRKGTITVSLANLFITSLIYCGCQSPGPTKDQVAERVRETGFHVGRIQSAYRLPGFIVKDNVLMFKVPPKGKQKPKSYYEAEDGKRALALAALDFHLAMTKEIVKSDNMQDRETWVQRHGEDFLTGVKRGLVVKLSPTTKIEDVSFSYGWLLADSGNSEGKSLSKDRATELLEKRRLRFSTFKLTEDIEEQLESDEQFLKIQQSYAKGVEQRLAMGSVAKDYWLQDEIK